MPIKVSTKLATAFILVGVVAAGLGWGSARFVRSPADVLAASEAPAPTPLSAQVRYGSLDKPTKVSGRVVWSNSLDVSVPAPMSGQRPIVTQADLRTGSLLNPGNVLVEIADRPLLLLPGAIPLLRDLKEGDTGPDVERLQESLTAAGYSTDGIDGVFGSSTSESLTDLYAASDYEPPLVLVTSRQPSTPDLESKSQTKMTQRRIPVATASELFFVPTFPVRIITINATIGKEVGESVAQLTTEAPTVTAKLPGSLADSLQLRGRIDLSIAGLRTPMVATVRSVGKSAASEDDGGIITPVVVDAPDIPPTLVGRRATLTITPPGKPTRGLIVPLTAVFAQAGGGAAVRNVKGAEITVIPVVIKKTVEGAAIVEETNGRGVLKKGDSVLMGAMP